MALKQISVFVANQTGSLEKLVNILAEAGVDMRAMSIADTQDFGLLRLIVNDNDTAAAVLQEKGYKADAPYSGTEYDLLSGKMTVYTDSIPIRREKKGNERANAVYGDLLAAAEALLKFVKTCKGRANKENAKFASQIRALLEKWK